MPPHLDRYLGFIPILAVVSTLQCSWQTVAATLFAALYNGGPVDLVYGFVLTYIGTLFLALSFAEMASIRPIAGAQYYWSADFAPFAPAFWGLIQGWTTVFAWVATACLGPFFASSLIEAVVILNWPAYVPQRWHVTLMMWAVMILPLLANVYARRLLKPIELVGVTIHLIGWLTVIATLLACVPAKDRNSTAFVFDTFVSGLSGWENKGVVFSLGLIATASGLTAFDGALHLSEEVEHPKTFVPHAMVWGLVFNGILAFGLILTALYTMGDYQTTLSASGFPIVEIFYHATRSRAAATVLMLFIIIAAILAFFDALASSSRLIWSFSRDGGLPFSPFFAHVDTKLRIPLRSLLLVTTVVFFLSFIQIGSTTAFNAFLSLSTLSLYLSYIVPVIFIAIRRARGLHISWGPFRLGRFGLPVNIVGIVFGVYMVVFLPFPPELPVTAVNMNYAGPVLGGVLVFALVDWSWRGRKRWAGPGSGKDMVELDHDDDDTPAERIESSSVEKRDG